MGGGLLRLLPLLGSSTGTLLKWACSSRGWAGGALVSSCSVTGVSSETAATASGAGVAGSSVAANVVREVSSKKLFCVVGTRAGSSRCSGALHDTAAVGSK